MLIYVAASWHTSNQEEVVQRLRDEDFDCYDFKHSLNNANGFHWSDIDPEWKDWSAETFRDALNDPIAWHGFNCDMQALEACDALVLLLPSGRSAHLEAGYVVGAGKPVFVLLVDDQPKLMYKMLDGLCLDLDGIVRSLKEVETKK